MKLDNLLRAHGFMRVERPPEIWEADTEDVRLVPLIGEMIAAALAGGGALVTLTLNASNIVVEEGDRPAAGQYVALTVSGMIDVGPDAVWPDSGAAGSGLLVRLHDRLVTAGAVFAYIRRTGTFGSMTVFLRRSTVVE